jgi:hypothetical protein
MTQDIEKISGSGSDISEALSVIAEKMGVDIGQLDFEIFRTRFGYWAYRCDCTRMVDGR